METQKLRKTKNVENELNSYYTIDYKFESSLNQEKYDPESYITTVIGIIKTNNELEDDREIGEIRIKIFHLGHAMDNPIRLMDIFDTEYSDLELFEDIFDYDTNDYKESILVNIESCSHDLCLIDKIVIEPDYRGKGLCKMIIDDLCSKFSGGCKMFILKVFPLQFEYEENSEFYKTMKFNELEKNKIKAVNKLKKVYKKCGFENIKNISSHLMFIDTAFRRD